MSSHHQYPGSAVSYPYTHAYVNILASPGVLQHTWLNDKGAWVVSRFARTDSGWERLPDEVILDEYEKASDSGSPFVVRYDRAMTMGDVALERTLIYDADCGFCTRSAKWLASSGNVNIKPWQGIRDLGALGLTEDMVETAAYWADSGEVKAGAEAAIAHALIAKGSGWALLGRTILTPGVRFIASRVYKVIARNRHAMPGGTDSCRI